MVKKEPTVPTTSMTTSKTAEVKTILGTMTFGWSYSSEDMAENESEKLLDFFIEEVEKGTSSSSSSSSLMILLKLPLSSSKRLTSTIWVLRLLQSKSRA